MGLADSVFRLFRENSDVVSLARLKRQGVRNVTVLDWDRIQQLIERAVEEALEKRRIDLPPQVLAGVHREAKEAFQRLVEQRDRFESVAKSLEQEKADLLENLAGLKGEISRSERQLATEKEHTVTRDEVAIGGTGLDRVVSLLQLRVRELAGNAPGADLGARIAAEARALIDAEREAAFHAAESEQRLKVEQLERRLSKLQRSLSDTEEVVAKLRSVKEGDEGVESIFKTVQGLDPGDQRAGEKLGLLDEIFRLNVELRDAIAAETSEPSPPAATRTKTMDNGRESAAGAR